MLNLMLHSLQPSHGAVNFILAQLYIGVYNSGFPVLAATRGRPEPGGGCAADNRSLCPPYEHWPGAGSANGADAPKSWIGPALPAEQSPLQAVHSPLGSPVPWAGQAAPEWRADSRRRQRLKTD